MNLDTLAAALAAEQEARPRTGEELRSWLRDSLELVSEAARDECRSSTGIAYVLDLGADTDEPAPEVQS